jgi:hypothetical protein
MADPLNNIRAAYHALQDCVVTALHTQIGDAPRLKITRDQVTALSLAAEQVCSLMYIQSIYSNDTIFGSQTKHLAVFPAADLHNLVRLAVAFLGQWCKEWLIAWGGVFAKRIPAPNILIEPY